MSSGTDRTTDVDGAAVTAAAVASYAATPDARLREVMTVLTRHLHAAVRELRPSLAEWEAAVAFLTSTGQACTPERQEVILLSDVLGISSLVESLTHQSTPDATEGTVLGPFHVVESPPRDDGASIDLVGRPDPCVVTGRVVDPAGNGLAGATVDVWQADDRGCYDVQVPADQPAGNGRGLFTTGADGAFSFVSVVPAPYPIPVDGPVGRLLHATERHPYRPAHIHLLVESPGHRALTTHVFVAGSDYLDSDAVFAVKPSLVADFAVVDDPGEAARRGVANPFRRAHVEVVLQPG